jgi:hypothetical protein
MHYGAIHLHGHVHGKDMGIQGRIYDVWAGGNNFTPYNAEELLMQISQKEVREHSENVQHRFYNGNTLAVSNHINQVVYGGGLSERDKSDMRNVADSMMCSDCRLRRNSRLTVEGLTPIFWAISFWVVSVCVVNKACIWYLCSWVSCLYFLIKCLHMVVVTVMIRQPTLLIKRLHLLYEFAFTKKVEKNVKKTTLNCGHVRINC